MMNEPKFEWSIHVYGSSSLGDARQEIEDKIDFVLDGLGEVTGGGAGQTGWNIDVEVFEGKDIETACSSIRRILRERGTDPSTTIQINRAERRSLV